MSPPADRERSPRTTPPPGASGPRGPTYAADMSNRSLGASSALDEQDRIAILQMLTLTPSERLDYFADEVEFEATPIEWTDA